MPKTDNPHQIRLYESLLKHTNEQTAERIAHKIPLSKSADINKKFAWAQGVCADLENELDDDTIKKVRMDCACGPGMGSINKLKKVYSASSDLKDFADRANALKQGFVINYEDGALYLIYPQCYCSCVKNVANPLPKAWCYCTLGYTKNMFENVLDRPVEVELVESFKTGGERCIIKIV